MGKKLIAVVNSDVPFIHGGHRLIASTLIQKLREYGYESDLIQTPSNPSNRMFSGYLANVLTCVEKTGDGRTIDQVISMRYPSYAVYHPVHVCWVLHRMREYYDLWPHVKKNMAGLHLLYHHARRFLVHRLDHYYLSRLHKVFALSQTVQKRLSRWGNIASEPLYPPPIPRDYRTEGYEPFIYTVSRLVSHKRINLLLEALALTRDDSIQAVVAGTGPEMDPLIKLAKSRGIDRRVTFTGMISEEESTKYFARCRAVYFSPFQEDYGFVTLEAFLSGKPVLTTDDSGGPAELVENDVNGFVTEAQPQQVAEKIDLLIQEETLAQSLGEAGRAKARGITWEKAIEKLVVP
ncbi:MAG: glycosyltransferase family 4 protein [Nitrospinales bacterium]